MTVFNPPTTILAIETFGTIPLATSTGNMSSSARET